MVKEAAAQIGKAGWVKRGALKFAVKVLDIKESYGHTRYLVTPLHGEGQEWTESVDIIA